MVRFPDWADMAGDRGPGWPHFLFTVALAAAGFVVAVRLTGTISTIGVFLMAFGIVLFFLAVLMAGGVG